MIYAMAGIVVAEVVIGLALIERQHNRQSRRLREHLRRLDARRGRAGGGTSEWVGRRS